MYNYPPYTQKGKLKRIHGNANAKCFRLMLKTLNKVWYTLKTHNQS